MIKVNFWKNKETGNYFAHKSGLTQEMVDEFKKLKPGDRLCLWLSDKQLDTTPDLTLKVFIRKEQQ